MISKQEKLKQVLLLKKEELLDRNQRVGDSLHRKDKPLEKDFSEQAIELENDQVLEALQQSSHEELLKINRALDRIEEGNYFFCSKCEEDIQLERLEAVPYTTLCIRCAQQQD